MIEIQKFVTILSHDNEPICVINVAQITHIMTTQEPIRDGTAEVPGRVSIFLVNGKELTFNGSISSAYKWITGNEIPRQMVEGFSKM